LSADTRCARRPAQLHDRSGHRGSAADAAARQEPPPKCLIVFAEGVAEEVERGEVRPGGTHAPPRRTVACADRAGARAVLQAALSAVHDAARDGCCGFVALRALPPDAPGAHDDDAVSACTVAQLLGGDACGVPLAKRFKGLRCVAWAVL
jgi:hypothetical protein